MAKILYKTSEEIEAEAKSAGREYFPCNYDFDNGRQRFLNAERREALAVLQQKLFNGEFDVFLDEIYAMGLPQEVISAFEDAYYGKPLYSLAIAATGETVNLDKLLSDLKNAQGNVEKQKDIAADLSAQLCALAVKGQIRDYYSVLLCLHDGYESAASRSLMGNFRNFYKYAAIYTGTDYSDEVYVAFSRLNSNISTDLKLLREYGSKSTNPVAEADFWKNLTMHTSKLMIDYANEYMNKVRK